MKKFEEIEGCAVLISKVRCYLLNFQQFSINLYHNSTSSSSLIYFCTPVCRCYSLNVQQFWRDLYHNSTSSSFLMYFALPAQLSTFIRAAGDKQSPPLHSSHSRDLFSQGLQGICGFTIPKITSLILQKWTQMAQNPLDWKTLEEDGNPTSTTMSILTFPSPANIPSPAV